MADLSLRGLTDIFLEAAAPKENNYKAAEAGVRAILSALASAAGDPEALGRVAAEAAANYGFTLDAGDAEELAKAVAAAMLARLLTLAAADLPAPDTWASECILRGYDRRTTAEYQAWLDMRERIAAAAAAVWDEIDRLRAENERRLALLRKCREAFLYVPPATTLTYASGGTVSEPIPVRLVPHPGLLAEIDAVLGGGGGA
jgi:hypothetical protein